MSLKKEQQIKVLIETLEKVEKPIYWKDLVKNSPLKDKVNDKGQGNFPTPNSYRSVMSSVKYNDTYKIFKRDTNILVVYSLQDNYKQEFERLLKDIEENK